VTPDVEEAPIHDRPGARQGRGAAALPTLAADGTASAGDQLSRSRKLFVLFLAGLLLIAAPLAWASSSAGANRPDDAPQAVLVKSQDDYDDDQDDDDTTTDTDDEEATAGDDSDTGTGTGTRGATSETTDDASGRETQANKTDRGGLHTGVSTRGETDPGDKTGKTERR
jgi:cytoskeletal protein RodZ